MSTTNPLPPRSFLVADLARIDAEERALLAEQLRAETSDDFDDDRHEIISDRLLDLHYDRGLALDLLRLVDEEAAEAAQAAAEARRSIY